MKSYLIIAAMTAFLATPAMAASSCDDDLQASAAPAIATVATPDLTGATGAAPAAPTQGAMQATASPNTTAVVNASYMKACKGRKVSSAGQAKSPH